LIHLANRLMNRWGVRLLLEGRFGDGRLQRGQLDPIPAVCDAGFEHYHLGNDGVGVMDTILPTARQRNEQEQPGMQHDGQQARHCSRRDT
jgi:hypothetical protein